MHTTHCLRGRRGGGGGEVNKEDIGKIFDRKNVCVCTCVCVHVCVPLTSKAAAMDTW